MATKADVLTIINAKAAGFVLEIRPENMWQDNTKTTQVSAVGDDVKYIEDQSIHGWDFEYDGSVPSTTAPIYQIDVYGNHYIKEDGAGALLTSVKKTVAAVGTAIGNKPYSISMATDPGTSGEYYFGSIMPSGTSSGSFNDNIIHIGRRSVGELTVAHWFNDENYTSSVTWADKAVHTAKFTDPGSEYFIDGVLEGSSTTVPSVLGTGFERLSLFGRSTTGSSAGNYFYGNTYAIVAVLGDTLSAGEQATIEEWLQSEMDETAAPSGTPYLTSGTVIDSETGLTSDDSGTFDTGTAGTDRILLVTASYENGGDPNITGMTYNGTALTKAVEKVVNPTDNFSETTEIWYLVAPATGVNTLSMTNSATTQDCTIQAAVYENVDQSNPIRDTGGTARELSDVCTHTLTVQDGDGVFWSVVKDRGGSTTFATVAGSTARNTVILGSTSVGLSALIGDNLIGSGSTTVGANVTTNGGQDNAIAVVVLAPVSSATTGSGTPQAQTATVTGAGARTVNVAGAFVSGGATIAGAGMRTITGSSTLATSTATVSGVAERVIAGSSTLVASTATVSGVAERVIAGSSTLAASTAAMDGAGATAGITAGTGALAAPPATLSMGVSLTRTGSATLQAAVAALSGVGQVIVPTTPGAGALAAGTATLSASGSAYTVIDGTGAMQAGATAFDASVAVTSTLTGSGALAAGATTITASGVVYVAASGALAAGVASVAGAGAVAAAPRTADGELQALPAEIVAQILRTVQGSGTITADVATADVYPWIELHTQDNAWEEQKVDWGKDL